MRQLFVTHVAALRQVAGWQTQIGTAEVKEAYRQRGGIAEIIHARMEKRRWQRFRLRGLRKAETEAIWQALAHNVERLLALGKLVEEKVRALAG